MICPSLCLVNFLEVPTFNRNFRIPDDTYALRGQNPSLGHLLLSHPLSLWWFLGLSFLTSPPGPALQAESVPKLDFCISQRVLPLKSLGC